MSRSEPSKRAYNAKNRQKHAEQAQHRILLVAKTLFEKNGFEKVTIDAIAGAADVSAQTVYAKFKSKRGILMAIIDNALPVEQQNTLVTAVHKTNVATEKLKVAAKLSRQLYDAEQQQMDWLRGAAIIDPVFKQLEKEREERRYQRQWQTVSLMAKKGVFSKEISQTKARDILWTFTGRDLYRMLVVERGWSSDDYENWLADTLIKTLLSPSV